MDRQEFLDTLGRALRREMPEQEVRDNISYYDHYIEQETAKGRSEAEVIAELGDPRLIARTILQVEEQKEDPGYKSAQSVYTDGPDGGYTGETYEDAEEQGPFGSHIKVHNISRTKACIILIAVLIVLFAILKTAFTIVFKLLPLLIVIGAALYIYQKYIKKEQ